MSIVIDESKIDEGGDIAGAEAPPSPITEPASGMSEEQVRKICEEVIGAFLDKFTPDAPAQKEEVEVEVEDLEY